MCVHMPCVLSSKVHTTQLNGGVGGLTAPAPGKTWLGSGGEGRTQQMHSCHWLLPVSTVVQAWCTITATMQGAASRTPPPHTLLKASKVNSLQQPKNRVRKTVYRTLPYFWANSTRSAPSSGMSLMRCTWCMAGRKSRNER